ncbi:large subunit ribosomal protein L28 [Chaetoceros tenuissimus]|uniref:Large ribosomal subunit protein bL28c n=1 Tax=Chaetoceros tenuissimus TaxID=426638 RepID=A0AAD3HCS7_9STRA|nr:large subunit ribosomal protein L28 [Chaetoceros tenuissimus]
MNSTLALLVIAAVIATASAFGVHTPVSGVSNGSGMTMRARECDLLGKKPNRQARVVTFSHKRNKKVQHVNLQTRKYFSDELGRSVKLRLSTKGLKTVEKYGGVDAAAKKFGLDLKKF